MSQYGKETQQISLAVQQNIDLHQLCNKTTESYPRDA